MLDFIIIAIVFALASWYIYHKMVKKKGCSSCASAKTCAASTTTEQVIKPIKRDKNLDKAEEH